MSPATAPRAHEVVPLSLIDRPALASRIDAHDDGIAELAASILRDGLIQPLILAQTGSRYEIIAGERRYLACLQAGLLEAEALIYPTREAAQMSKQYAENRYRKDLTAIEEAVLFSDLLERDHAGDVDRLCAAIGETRAYVEGRLLLLQLDDETQTAVHAGQMPIGVAQQLLRVTDLAVRKSLFLSAIHGGATIAVMKGWVDQWVDATRGRDMPDVREAAGGAAPSIVSETPFRCICCDRTDNTHVMRPHYIHDHCWLAILRPFLEQLLATTRDPRRI